MLDESFEVMTPSAQDFNRAVAMLHKFNARLRAEDALHLAIASNRKAERFLTLDATLIRVARGLRIPADSGISR
jgi:predicted nucleic acid-binding protein